MVSITNETNEVILELMVRDYFHGNEKIVIDDFDLDRVYIHVDGVEHVIRMWNICDRKERCEIQSTLFEISGDHGLYMGDNFHSYSAAKIRKAKNKMLSK